MSGLYQFWNPVCSLFTKDRGNSFMSVYVCSLVHYSPWLFVLHSGLLDFPQRSFPFYKKWLVFIADELSQSASHPYKSQSPGGFLSFWTVSISLRPSWQYFNNTTLNVLGFLWISLVITPCPKSHIHNLYNLFLRKASLYFWPCMRLLWKMASRFLETFYVTERVFLESLNYFWGIIKEFSATSLSWFLP